MHFFQPKAKIVTHCRLSFIDSVIRVIVAGYLEFSPFFVKGAWFPGAVPGMPPVAGSFYSC